VPGRVVCRWSPRMVGSPSRNARVAGNLYRRVRRRFAFARRSCSFRIIAWLNARSICSWVNVPNFGEEAGADGADGVASGSGEGIADGSADVGVLLMRLASGAAGSTPWNYATWRHPRQHSHCAATGR
jgi:hypothetical protein